MGLDQYLSAKISLRKGFGKEKSDVRRAEVRKIFPEMFKSGNIEYIHIKFEAGYWRKANHIHKWFVENVQDGKDDCGDYYVSRKNLQKLLDDCKAIMNANKTLPVKDKIVNKLDGTDVKKQVAKNILPTQSGFFFGGEDYDEWYFDSIKNTIEIINKCLKLSDEWQFEYHSSW